MPKRPASTDISCPGCSANFDTETRVAFMGSCGDSICAVCLSEKKIKNCPECNLEGAFACCQKNTLAMKFLSTAAEMEATDSKKARLDVGEDTDASGEPVPAILDPKNLPFLAQIVNQLNPTWFLNLASTCKTLKNYCFNCKDVKIIYEIALIIVKMDDDGFKFNIQESADFDLEEDGDAKYNPRFLPMDYTRFRHGFLSSAVGRRKLRNYPFEFRLKELEFREVNRFDEAFFTPLRKLFAEFPIKTVSSFCTCRDFFFDWVFPAVSEVFLQFLKDFRIMRVDFSCAKFDGNINEEFLKYLFQNTASFSADLNFPERLLLKASVPRLHLSGPPISKRTFVELIKKFVDSTDEISWHLSYDRFELQDALRSFKLLPFDHEGPLPDEHPIIFVKDDGPNECWLLRQDGKIMECDYDSYYVHFTMLPQQNYPPCLRRDVENDSESHGDSNTEPGSKDGSGDKSSY